VIMEKKKKVRALNMGKRWQKEIISLYNTGLSVSEILNHYQGKFSYWQIYNTINPRQGYKKPDANAEPDNTVVDQSAPPDLSEFASVESYLEHKLTSLFAEMDIRRMSIEKHLELTKKATDIYFKLKQQRLESYLKEGGAKIIVNVMRRLNPELSDDQILNIYQEEAEKLKGKK